MDRNFKVKFIVFILFFAVTLFIYFFSGSLIDRKVDDFFTKIITIVLNKKASDDVLLVEVDNKSLSQITWPWRRDLFSDIFDFLENNSGAKVIVFDNLLLFPDTYYPESDNLFNSRLKSFNTVINSYILFNSSMSANILPEQYINIFDSKSNVNISDEMTDKSWQSYRGVYNIPKDFLYSAKIFASSTIPEDNDEIVRNYMPIVKLNEKFYPSLALSAFAKYSGINSYTLDDNFLCSSDNCKTLKMPVKHFKAKDYIGNSINGIFSYYNWYKPIGVYYSHKKYSAIDILTSYYAIKDGRKPKISPDTFKDKIVVFGLNADKNVWDRLSETPILKKQSDIDVHATMISNMLHNSFKSVPDNNHIIFLTLLFSFFIIRGFKHLKNNLLFASIFVILYLTYYFCEFISSIYIPPASPIITMYSVAILKYIYNFITSDKNSELMKRAMSKYVSKDVMRKVVSNLDKLNVGGVRTEVTILFVDIRNFTQIAENNEPGEVSSILNDYFSVVEPIIAKYGGVVNKYMGDGILAVFGEPIKDDNHAINAVKSGIEILREVKKLKDKFIAENKPVIDIGIGINTGEVFAGNIGTNERLEYTVIGDNVNLAYRIEAYNHTLKTQFLISESTYERSKKYIDVVKLSHINIKGKSKPIDIYEVLRLNNNG